MPFIFTLTGYMGQKLFTLQDKVCLKCLSRAASRMKAPSLNYVRMIVVAALPRFIIFRKGLQADGFF